LFVCCLSIEDLGTSWAKAEQKIFLSVFIIDSVSCLHALATDAHLWSDQVENNPIYIPDKVIESEGKKASQVKDGE
jgi:hypothetical protein